jgi:hypothetical protein
MLYTSKFRSKSPPPPRGRSPPAHGSKVGRHRGGSPSARGLEARRGDRVAAAMSKAWYGASAWPEDVHGHAGATTVGVQGGRGLQSRAPTGYNLQVRVERGMRVSHPSGARSELILNRDEMGDEASAGVALIAIRQQSDADTVILYTGITKYLPFLICSTC